MIRQGYATWLVCLALVVLPGAGDVNRRREAARAMLRLDHFEVKLTRFSMGGRDPKANIKAVENSQAGPGTKDFAFAWSFSWDTGSFGFKGKLTVNTPLTIAVGDSAPISATGNGDWNNSGFGYDRDPGILVWAGGTSKSKLVDKQVSNGSFGVHNVTASSTMRTAGITGDTSIDFGATSAFACNRGGCGDGTGCPFGVLCCCGYGVEIEVKAVYKHEEARPEITLDRASLTYTARPGETGPAPQRVAVSNSGGGVLNWQASATYTGPAGADAWLAVKPASGTLASGESASFEVSVDPLRLVPGETHTASISVSGNASNSPQAVAVTAEYQRDLAVDRIEVVQVVQDADQTVPLMARKKTVARVFIKLTPASSQPVAGVSSRLRGSRSDGEMPDSPLRPFNGPITAPVSPRRDSLDHSLNFELPAAWTEGGALRLEAEVRPPAGFRDAWADDTLSRTATFIEPAGWPRPFIVGYLPVCYQPPGQARPLCPNDANISGADVLLRKLYPVTAEDIFYLPLPPKVWRRALTSSTQDQLITAIRKHYELMDSGAELMDQVAAWLPPIPNPANPADAPALGMSDPKWSGGSGLGRVSWQQDTTATDRLDPAFTLAHELAHNFGRRHTNLPDGCNAIDPDTDWKLPDSTVQDVGFDPEARQVKPASLKDVMTYCSPPAANIWISPFTYRKLIDSRLAPQGAAAAAAKGTRTEEGPAEYAIASGSARRDGSAGRLDPVYRVTASGPAPPPSAQGNHCLRFSKAEALLATYCFNLEFKDHRTGRPLEEESFTLKVPYPAGTTRVSLMRDERELASLNASSGAPAVSITAPQAGERWSGGPLTITWSASHPEGSPLTYSVLYSPDGGRAWTPLELDWPEPQYELDPTQITGGKQVFFRVLATDGLNTAQAMVGPIEIVQTPRGELEPAALDFRKVLVGQNAERTLVLKNRGTGPLTVRSLALDVSAFSVATPKTPFTVVAGSQRNITVRFTPAAAGALAGKLAVNCDDPSPAGSPVLLAGSGVDRLVPQIEIAPGELDFGSVNAGETKDLQFKVSNVGPGALKVTAITSSSSQFSVLSPAQPFQVAPGAEQPVSVRFQPASAGSFPAALTIANDDPDRPVATVAVRGAAVAPPRPQMRIEPASLDFGAVAVGQSKDLAFSIRNTGGVTLAVSAITSGNPRFTVVSPAPPFEVAAGAAVSVTLRFAPTAAGAENGSLAIAGNDPNLATATLALSGSGVVTPVTQNPAPAIGSLSPASITAGGPAFTLTLNGSNFVNASVAEWNGASRPTVVVSATQLTASIGAADIAAPGIASVTVSNPAPGGGRSTALTIVITQPAAAGPSVLINQIDVGECPIINAYVSVLDSRGNSTAGLSDANLACMEDGQPVRCAVAPGAGSERALSVALIIGTSPAPAATELDLLKGVAREFVNQLGENDRAAILQLDREAQPVSGFTNSKPGLAAAIDSLQPVGGGTALYDAVLQGINLASQQRGRRQAIVVLASGENTSGTVRDANRVISAAASAGVPIFSFASGAGAGNRNLEDFLRQLAAQTAGQFDSQSAAMTLLLPMQRLAQTLVNQYVIGYATSRKDGQTHTLGIRFTGSQGTASATRPYSRCGP